MTKPIILVTGGRTFSDYDRMKSILDELQPGLIVEGGCRRFADGAIALGTFEQIGADWLACRYGHERGIHVLTVSALWDYHKKAAGPRRNTVMVEIARRLGCTLCVAFPGGAGTADCVDKARKAGLEVRCG